MLETTALVVGIFIACIFAVSGIVYCILFFSVARYIFAAILALAMTVILLTRLFDDA
jgi:ABC-type arginine/histidine transport system permease subunit